MGESTLPRLVVDLRMMDSGGIGTYLRNLLPELMDRLPGTRFVLLGQGTELASQSWVHRDDVELVQFEADIYSCGEQFDYLRRACCGDLFWSPHFNVPVLRGGKLLVTVHDLFHLANPESASGLKHLYAKIMFAAIKRKAAAIICVSNFTAAEFARLAGPTPKLRPIHIGVADDWFRIERGKPVHNRPYILFVGNVKPHKNLSGLLQAFILLEKQIAHGLVIVGRKEGFRTGDEESVRSAEALGERVRLTGRLEGSELQQFVTQAEVLVFPSFYEGFGLPPLEAMACGCPVVASNAASIPEICGEAVLYCDPCDPRDIANQILRIITDSTLRESLRRKGLERARRFTWARCADETALVIDELLHRGR